MEKIIDGIFIGNSNDANDDNIIKNYGIKSILNVAFDLDVKQRENILTVKVGMIDGNNFNVNDIALDVAVDVLSYLYTHNKPILVCCHAGINRSRFVIYKCLVERILEISCEEAIKLTNLLIRDWMRRYM